MKLYRPLLYIVTYFVITALLASLLGKFIDRSFGIAPVGLIATLATMYVVSLGALFLYVKKTKLI